MKSRQPAPFESRVLPELLARLRNEGHSAESLARQLARLEIELVLTAHPTEVARRTLIQKYDAIAAQLAAQDHRDLTTAEREQIQNTLQRLIAEAWHTEEIRRIAPDAGRRGQVGLCGDRALAVAGDSQLHAQG